MHRQGETQAVRTYVDLPGGVFFFFRRVMVRAVRDRVISCFFSSAKPVQPEGGGVAIQGVRCLELAFPESRRYREGLVVGGGGGGGGAVDTDGWCIALRFFSC